MLSVEFYILGLGFTELPIKFPLSSRLRELSITSASIVFYLLNLLGFDYPIALICLSSNVTTYSNSSILSYFVTS